MAAGQLTAAARRPTAARTTGQIVLSILKHLGLMLLGVSFLLPFWWMVATSLKPNTAVFHVPPLLIPFQDPAAWPDLIWSNYPRAFTFTRPPFTTFIWNTLVIAFLAVAGTLFSSPMAAYGLSRIRWPGRGILFGLTLSTLFLPAFVTLIPLFLIYRTVGWIGTPLPLIVPHWFGDAFYIFLLRQFFMTIPQELSEAARIDGAGEVRIYTGIILPLAKPALASVALFEFLNRWRDFFGPLIFLTRKETYTISLGLNFYRYEYDTEWGLMMAMSVCVTLPIIILFFFVQRTFIQGITLTGIKG
jgi:multiple sugar transport system permease protein